MLTRPRRLAALLLALSPVSAAIPPPGFDDEEVVCLSPGDPEQIAFAPDGDLFIGAGYGKVWVWRAGVAVEVAFLAVNDQFERGLNGLAVDPDYTTNHYLYVQYTTPEPSNDRVSRFTFDGAALVDEVVIFDGPPIQNGSHHAGDIQFAPDGSLFAATGNDEQNDLSQDPFDPRGKILRLRPDGSPAPGNPFADGVLADPRVWALGLRNPYRIAIDPGAGTPWIADVGHATWEEVSRGIAGANYGWPAVQGPAPGGLQGYVYPVHAYSHNDGSAAIIGGDFAGPGDFLPEYEGDYFFADFVLGQLFRMKRDSRGNPAWVELWATDFFRTSDMEFGPDGSLYYVRYGGGPYPRGCVRRIARAPGANRPPVTIPAAAPDSGSAPLQVAFDGTASTDPEGGALDFLWDTGDAETIPQAAGVHVYPAGVYFADLTVDDGAGGSDRSPSVRIVSGNRRPVVSITSPATGASYVAGQVVAFSGSATDPEEGAVPCSRWSWQVVRRHGAHAHPIHGPVQGACAGTFTIADKGDAAADERYEIVGVASDTGAPLGATAVLSGEHAVTLVPTTSSFTIETEPLLNLEIALDGQPIVAPHTEPGVVDFVRALGAPASQVEGGRTYRWLSWSNGGAREHEIRTPAVHETIVASFGCNVLAEVSNVVVSKGGGGAIDLAWAPVADPCLGTAPGRYRVHAASTPRPSAPPGTFPEDPPFAPIGTSDTESFTDPSPADTVYYLVVAMGSDLLPGPSGS